MRAPCFRKFLAPSTFLMRPKTRGEVVNSSRLDELVDGVFGRLASHVLPLYWLLLGLLGISNVLLGQGRGGREGREKGRRVSSAALARLVPGTIMRSNIIFTCKVMYQIVIVMCMI